MRVLGLTAKLAGEKDAAPATAAAAADDTTTAADATGAGATAAAANGASTDSANKGAEKSSSSNSGNGKGKSRSSRSSNGNSDAMDVVGAPAPAPAAEDFDFASVGEAFDLSGDRAMQLQWHLMQQRITMPSSARRGVIAALAPIIASDLAGDQFAEGTSGERFDLYNASSMSVPSQMEEEADLEKDHRMLSSLSMPQQARTAPA